MSIVSPDKYGFAFAELAKLETPLKTLSAAFQTMSLRPDTIEELALMRVFFALARRGGIGAALNRLLPQSPYAGVFIEFSPGVTVALVNQKIGSLEIARRNVLGQPEHHLNDTTISVPYAQGKELVYS